MGLDWKGASGQTQIASKASLIYGKLNEDPH